jgi:hypothetical protein
MDVRVSCDFRMAAGTRWPDELKQRIRSSALLLAIWSADYFRSDWCMAEWQSFRERERALGLFGTNHPQGLVYPVRYADGDYFHPEALLAQCNRDFSALNYPDDAFRLSAKYIEFDQAVQDMAQDLVHRLNAVPTWRADFPIVEPGALPPITFPRPVL